MIKKIKETDWWELTYLIIYGIIFSKEFLQTTMFPIPWPLGLGYVFALMSGGYVIAKFLFHNTYTKKEMILAILILIAFCVPALTTDYTYLFWTGCLIVGAKDVDFNKILKVYLVIGITIMVAAFSVSQYGRIEDLEYLIERNGSVFVRHSYGMVYPTDYAAHVFFIILVVVCFYDKRIKTSLKQWIIIMSAACVYFTSNAQTALISLVLFSIFVLFESLHGKIVRYMMSVLKWIPLVCAMSFISLSYVYDTGKTWMAKLNVLFSSRIGLSKTALEQYGIKLFGQNVIEVGSGLSTEWKPGYFFLDDSYIRILVKYGFVLFVITMLMLIYICKKANKQNKYIYTIAICVIAIHSVMEHRLIDIAYNPILFALFASFTKVEQIDGRKKCIEKVQKVG